LSARADILRGNEAYAAAFDRGDLRGQPARRVAVVTCMDARIPPLAMLGFDLGDAHVIRNAGGLVTDDALRSLAISHWELGTQEAYVIGHTSCGMATFTNDTLRRKLEGNGIDASQFDFLPFADLEESIRASVRRVRESPLLPAPYEAHGFVYDVGSGRLTPVE
jgi:carbonic anhydrase